MLQLNSLLIAQSERITYWFTTTWLISLGVLTGMVIVALYLLKVWAMSRIGLFNRVGGNRVAWWTMGILSGGVLAALAAWGIIRGRGWEQVQENLMDVDDFGVGGDGYLTLVFPVLACFFIGFGHWAMVWSKRTPEVLGSVGEGFLKWMNWVTGGLCLFAIVGFLLSLVNGFGIVTFVDDPQALLNSLARLPFSGERVIEMEIPPSGVTDTGTEIPVDFLGEEFRFLRVEANQQLDISAIPISQALPMSQLYKVPSTSAVEPFQAYRSLAIPDGPITNLYVANRGRNIASMKLRYYLRPVYFEVYIVPIAAGCTVLLYLLFLSSIAISPKVSAIGLSTFKTEVSQPVFYLAMIGGLLFVVISIFLPYNTFGEDIKMYKDSGLTLIRVLAIFIAIWASSKSVAEEIEGRTALTVLSKPVSRRQFILGKVSGIAQVIAIIYVILGLWLVFWTSFKPIYDAVETSKGSIEWAECWVEATSIIPALALGFLEAVVFVAISVAISTRLGILPNLVICFSIYVLGHLTPLLVMSSTVVNAFEPVVVFGRLIATVFPVLDYFTVEAAITSNAVVPVVYLLMSLLYSILYGAIAVLVALVFFEDRDLA